MTFHFLVLVPNRNMICIHLPFFWSSAFLNPAQSVPHLVVGLPKLRRQFEYKCRRARLTAKQTAALKAHMYIARSAQVLPTAPSKHPYQMLKNITSKMSKIIQSTFRGNVMVYNIHIYLHFTNNMPL